MKHICDTLLDYIYAEQLSQKGDIIYCTEEVWQEVVKHTGFKDMIDKAENDKSTD